MLYITQLIYINEGQEEVFDQFEAVATPLIAKYNGRLLLRVRPGADAWVETAMDRPYEIHLVAFGHETDFAAFMHDGERQRFLHLKQQSVRASLLFKGEKLG